MVIWHEALIISLAGFIILIAVLCFLVRLRFFSNKVAVTESVTTTSSFAAELDPVKSRHSYQLFHRGSSARPSYFNWADHPTLINEAVENGWSRFAFTYLIPSSSSVRSSLLNSLRVTGDQTHNNHVEESWEVGINSVEFMQKLHFKMVQSSNTNTNTNLSSNFSIVRMALPLPGPHVVDSFPQEAYFEMTVMRCLDKNGIGKGSDEEKTKLLNQRSDSSSIGIKNGDTIVQVSGRRGRGGREGVKMAIGMSVGRLTMLNKLPGIYPGSIGFHSDGSVYLAGMKLVFESQKEDWAQTGKIIGCGFDPRLKKVFFTVDSELVHVVHCKSDDFGMPLYPVLAANADIIVLVNLGQSDFSYSPANAQRTPNPCFIGPVVRSSSGAFGYEDSKELFSMGLGRLDSEWLSHSATVRSTSTNTCNNNSTYNKNNKLGEHDEELEADELFEIVLDSTEN